MAKHIFDKDGKKIGTVKTDIEVKREAGAKLALFGLAAASSLPISVSLVASSLLSAAGVHSFFVFVVFCLVFYGVVKLSFRNSTTQMIATGLTVLINSVLVGLFMNLLLDDKIWSGVFAIGGGYITYWILTNFVSEFNS